MIQPAVTDSVLYIGVDDKTIDLFESQYIVPNGVSYNSYLIKDQKNTVMDTVDKRATEQWLDNLNRALDGEQVDYLVVLHMEPDHASNIQILAEKFPKMKIVGNAKTFMMINQFLSCRCHFSVNNSPDFCNPLKMTENNTGKGENIRSMGFRTLNFTVSEHAVIYINCTTYHIIHIE